MSTWNEEEDGMGFAGLVYSSETSEYADAKVAEGERLAQEADELQTNAYAEGRKDEREAILEILKRDGLELRELPSGTETVVAIAPRKTAEVMCGACNGSGTRTYYCNDPDWPSEEGDCDMCNGTGARLVKSGSAS